MKNRILVVAAALWVAVGCGSDDAPPDAASVQDAGDTADAAAPDAAVADAAVAGPPCYGVSAAGCCEGTTVIFCEREALQEIECAPYPCGWSDVNQLFKCNGQDPLPNDVSASCPAGLP